MTSHLRFRSNRIMFEAVGRVIVFVHNHEPMPNDDHQRVAALYASLGDELSHCRTLVITDGGAPTKEQRKETQATYGAKLKGTPIALISDAVSLRFIGATLTLVVRSMKVFPSTDLGAALDFLELRGSQVGEVRSALRSMIGDAPPGRFKAFDAIAQREGFRSPLAVAT